MDVVVRVDRLRKSYGAVVAAAGLSFEVRRGEVFGMVGPNGAGKTTTIECLEGLRAPDSGVVRVLGVDPRHDGRTVRERCGMQLQQSSLPDRMRVWEALDLYASFYERPADWRALLAQLGLEDKRRAPFAKLSGGQKQRLFIALALLPNPELVFLDELTTGLDPQARRATWELVRAVSAKGTTVFMTTHFMEEAERLCDRVAILDRGTIVALDTPAALVRSLGDEERVAFDVDGTPPERVKEALGDGVELELSGSHAVVHRVSGGAGALVSEVVARLGSGGVRFRDLRTEQPNLEEVFLRLTGRAMRE